MERLRWAVIAVWFVVLLVSATVGILDLSDGVTWTDLAFPAVAVLATRELRDWLRKDWRA